MKLEKIVDRDSKEKLYVQIYSIIKEKIENGDWPSGKQIPIEDELCKTYDVSKVTVREAISELVREGYLKRQQGKGTFVTYSIRNSGLAMKTRLTEDMFGEGVKVQKELLVKGIREPSEEIKTYLKAEDDVYYLLCKGVVEDEPAYIEELYIPLVLFPGIEGEVICPTSLYDLIQEKAIRKISKVVQTIEVTKIKGDAADILKVKEGTPALLIHRLFIGHDKDTIAYARLIGSSRRYKIQTEFERIN
ncbi:MAG: GntR family transcriptional regulator [Nitrospirae bacterium]|nr:GntR family transcriptional regulator [Nitrospirota bacterium]